MDPTVTLRELRVAIDELSVPGADVGNAINRVHELWRALDDWLSSGGFPPAQWGNLITRPDPVRVRDVDEMLELLKPDPWRQ